MSEWTTKPLKDVAEIRSSNVDKKSNPGEQPVRLCNYMDVYSHEYITKSIAFMEATATSAEIDRFGIERGDVMITKDSETPDDIGISAVVVDEIPNLVCGYHVALIKPNRTEIEPIYLAKQLATVDSSRYFGRLANGSTRYGLAYGAIANTPIRWAPLTQQQRIAEILSTVDEAIEQTEVLIAKTQQIKAGLMHDLFTRGATKDGQLRPPREEAPQLYKESPLGWIPKEWDAAQLGSIADSLIDGPFGSNLKTQHYVEGEGVRVVRLQNIQEGEYNDNDRAFVSHSHAASLGRHQVVAGDILIAALGEDNYPVGRSCCYPATLPPAINKADCFRLRCNPIIANNNFVMGFLNMAMARVQIRRYEQGVTRRRINLGNMKRVFVALPSTDEQQIVIHSMKLITDNLTEYLKEREKQILSKAGLMHDLLTGRVRVKTESLPPTEPAHV